LPDSNSKNWGKYRPAIFSLSCKSGNSYTPDFCAIFRVIVHAMIYCLTYYCKKESVLYFLAVAFSAELDFLCFSLGDMIDGLLVS
jgi:phosphatidylglycerophosphate synthase